MPRKPKHTHRDLPYRSKKICKKRDISHSWTKQLLKDLKKQK